MGEWWVIMPIMLTINLEGCSDPLGSLCLHPWHEIIKKILFGFRWGCLEKSEWIWDRQMVRYDSFYNKNGRKNLSTNKGPGFIFPYITKLYPALPKIWCNISNIPISSFISNSITLFFIIFITKRGDYNMMNRLLLFQQNIKCTSSKRNHIHILSDKSFFWILKIERKKCSHWNINNKTITIMIVISKS